MARGKLTHERDPKERDVELTLTAVICTRNRSAWTRLAVASLLAQDLPADRLDLLVVDNGSTDDTHEVLQSLAEQHPAVRWCSEPEAGLSRARNRAIENARGEVVAFLDDDAEASPSWARLHLAAFEDASVQASGGRIILDWPGERPEWLPEGIDSMYSGLDIGPEPREFEPTTFPFGANMAIRRSAFDTIGRFSVDLGRRGTNLLSGEERDLFERLRSTGARIVYVPDASVVHHVLPDRIGRGWFLRRCYDQGRSRVLIDLSRTRRRRVYWFARAGWQLGKGVRHTGVAMGRRVRSLPSKEVTSAAIEAAQAAGTALESLRVAIHVRQVSEPVTS